MVVCFVKGVKVAWDVLSRAKNVCEMFGQGLQSGIRCFVQHVKFMCNVLSWMTKWHGIICPECKICV